jgi:hypothetical protein
VNVIKQLIASRPDAALVDEYLLDRYGDRNTVRVVKREKQHNRLRVVSDEIAKVRTLPAALVRLDEIRVAAGLPARHLKRMIGELGGDLVGVSFNLRTTVGIDYTADSLGKSSSRPAVAEYIAVTTDSGSPAAGDTTLASEISTGGLARAQATYAHSGGATSYTLTKAFTASATHTAVVKGGVFNASSSGTMFLESTFTSASLVSGDTLTITWTCNV